MDHEIDALLNTKEGVKQQSQGLKARVAWILMILTAPFLSPLYLLFLFFYQCCLVERLSPQAKAVTAVSAIFFGIAWIPIVTVVLYMLSPAPNPPTSDQNDVVNAFCPAAALAIFCCWGSVVAFRHFSITDSYEPEKERSSIRRLQSIQLDPPLVIMDPANIPETLKSSDTLDAHTPIVTLTQRTVGRGGFEISNALQLYLVLKGDLRHTVKATILSVVLAGLTVTIVRTTTSQNNTRLYSEPLYWLSTVFFVGMFLVFYCTFAFIITIYVHQVSFIQRLTYALDDNAPPRMRFVRVEAMHLKQLRAWEECRRLAVEELTSPKSILNAVFTPSMWLSAICVIVGFSYVFVYKLLIQQAVYAQFSITLTIIILAFIGFMTCSVVVAKIAQKHFKRHSALIAQKTFDIARQVDVYHTNLEQGIEEDEEESVGVRRVYKVVAAAAHTRSGSTSTEQVERDGVSLVTMEQIYASLHSLCTYMIANQPRPLILGIELRHVRFLVVFVMLVSGNVFFVSLMIAFKNGECGKG